MAARRPADARGAARDQRRRPGEARRATASGSSPCCARMRRRPEASRFVEPLTLRAGAPLCSAAKAARNFHVSHPAPSSGSARRCSASSSPARPPAPSTPISPASGATTARRAPPAAATRRRAGAVAAARRSQGQGRRVSRARRSARRYAGRVLPRHGHAGLDARLRRLSDGDRAARGPHHRRLRGARRDSPHLLGRAARTRRICSRIATATRSAAGKATSSSSRRRI